MLRLSCPLHPSLLALTLPPSHPLSCQQFEKVLKQRHLEVQLSEAKLAQHTVVAAEEKEISLQERQQVGPVRREPGLSLVW